MGMEELIKKRNSLGYGSDKASKPVGQKDLLDFRARIDKKISSREDPLAFIDGDYIDQYLSDHQQYWSGYGAGKDDAVNKNYRLDERRAAIDSWLSGSLADGTIDQEWYDQVSGLLGQADSSVGMYQGQRDAGTYMNDWREWYNQSADALDGMDWSTGRGGGAFIDEAMAGFADRDAATRAWLEENRAMLGEGYYKSMLAELDSYGGYADELRAAYDQNAEYFGQWESQDAFDRQNYLEDLDIDSMKTGLDALKAAYDDMYVLEGPYGLLANDLLSEEDRARHTMRYEDIQQAYGANSEEILAKIEKLEKDIREAEELQAGIAQGQKLSGIEDKYSGMSYQDMMAALETVTDPVEKAWLQQNAPAVMTDADYEAELVSIEEQEKALSHYIAVLSERYTQLENTDWNALANGTEEEKRSYSTLQSELAMLQKHLSQAEQDHDALMSQKWQLEQDRKYAVLDERADFDERSAVTADEMTGGFGIGIGKNIWLGKGDAIYDYINFLDGSPEAHEARNESKGRSSYSVYDRMADDERKRYNYLYNTEGRDAATEYLKYLEPELDKRVSMEASEQMAALAESHPLFADALNIPLTLTSGIGYLDIAAQNASRKLTGSHAPINYYTPFMNLVHEQRAISKTRVQNITDKYGVIDLDPEDHPYLAPILNGRGLADVYQLGMSAINSKVAALTGNPVLATTLLASSAATQGVLDALERGATDEQALTMGLWNGVFEALFEFWEVNELLKGKPSWVKAAVNQAITEGVGEGATSIANNIADGIIMADKSALQQAAAEYMDNEGLSYEDAYRKAFADMMVDIGWDIVGGAASGAMSVVGMAAGSAVANRVQYASLPKTVKNSVERLQGFGLDKNAAIDASIALYQGAEGYGDQAAAYMAAFDPKQDPYTYASDFRQAYEIGRNNGNREYLGKLSLNEDQRKIAYELGAAASRKAAQEAKAPKNSESDAEWVYSVSDDGATIDSTGKAVKVKGFASVGDKAVLELEDGKTIDAKEVSFGTADEAILYETVAQVTGSADTANRILNSYNSVSGEVSASDFAAGLRQAYDLGVSGQVAERQLGTYELAGKLPAAARSAAFNRGKTVGDYMATARQATREARGRQVKGQRQGQLHFDRKGRTFDSKRESALKAMEALSKALGIDIYVYESYVEGGKRVYQGRTWDKESAPNGFYDKDGIHIDLNAGNFGQGTMMFTVAHELTHFIKEWSPVKFRKLADILVNRYAEQGVSVRELIDRQIAKAKENGRDIDRDTAFEEVVADSMETMLTQGDIGDFMAQLKQKDKTLRDKIREWFRNLADSLKAVADEYRGAKPESPEGRLVAQMDDFVKVLQQAYAEALVEAGENYRANEGNKKTTQEGGVKYSDKYLAAEVDANVLNMVTQVASGNYSDNDKVELGKVPDHIATKIKEITGVDASGFRIVIEARQMFHILKDHGPNGKANRSMEDPNDIARIKYVIFAPDDISGPGTTRAYAHQRNGKARPAPTVLYEKNIGEKSYYVVQAVPDTKAKTVYIVSAFIGESGYKKEASQLINASNGPDATAKPGSVVASKNSIRDYTPEVKGKFSMRDPVEHTKNLVALHNLTEDKLAKTLDLGGFPMPSIAITKADIPHTNFGDITLVFGRETIDPKANKKNVVYSADAWTPVFPRTEYEENQEAGNRVYKRLSGLERKISDTFKHDLRRVYTDIEGQLNRYNGEEGLIEYAIDNYGMKAAYLEEQGNHISEVTVQKEADLGYNPANAEMYQKIADVLGVTTAEEMGRYSLKKARDEHGDELEAIRPGITKSPMRLSGFLGRARNYMARKDSGPVYETVTDDQATRNAVDDALDQAAYEAWVRKLFSGIVKDSGIYNNKPIFTSSGNRRSFKQTHLPVTLENIVKAMATQNGGSTKNVSGFNGIKTLRAGTAERFKSVEAMHKREGRLQNLTPEELEAVSDALQTRLYDIIKAIDAENGGKGSDNSLIRYDTIGEIITEISESGKFNVADIQQPFRGYGKEVSDDTALALKQLLFDVAQMPVNIFEAKPERVVGLNEIKAAILPKGTSRKVVEKLEQNGVPVRFYEAGNDAERVALVNGMEEAKFSERDAGAEKVAAALERQNAKLKQDVKDLRELVRLQGKLTHGGEFTRTSIEAAMRSLTKTAMAKLDAEGRQQLSGMLKDFYRYIATDKELAWEGVTEKAGQIADFLMDNVTIKPQRDGYADEVLRNLRGARVRLSDSQRAEVEKLYGYENFRKTLFGAGVYLSKDGMELDIFWHEQASEFPGTFTEDVYEGDQPAELLSIIDAMREGDDSAAMEYAYNREFIRQGLIRSIYDSYWRVDNMNTVADRKQKEINEIRRKHRERMTELKEEQRHTVRDLKEKRRADIAAVRKEYQEKNRKQLDAMRERHKESRERANESRSAAHQRQSVEKAAKSLMDMLSKPSKEAHVPLALQAPLEKLLNSIDFSSKRALSGGELTIRDVAYTRALQEVKAAIAKQRTALEGDADGTFSLDVPRDFLEQIDEHIGLINKATEGLDLTTNRIYEMTSDELKDLAFILKTINRAIRDIDRLHMAGAKARVSELAKSTVWEMGRRKAVKTEDGGEAMWANYTPTFAFERMGKAATQILDGLKTGQAKLARTAAAVIKFSEETYTGKEVKAWENEVHEVTLGSGETVKMTTAQIMSFYCLSRREQAKGHLTGGGIRMGNIGEGRKTVRQTDHFRLTQEDIAKINGLLTDRQIEVANKLQRYMADVGGRLGNEISMARWDYMEMTDRDYFPIRSDSDIHDARNPDQDKTNLWALLNKSFTKQVTKGANDAMIVSSIFDVFADHMSDMAEYNAFALPLVDAMKWYNYRESTKYESGHVKTVGVKKALTDKLGTAAAKYFIDLMTDINSSQKAGRYENFFGKLLSRSKAASVGWNLRVAIQQPTAILRASVYLDPMSLVKGTVKKGMKASIEEMKKYSGIALWKSLGYYDLNISRGIRDQIKGDTTVLDQINDAGMWLPGKMDEVTWSRIWESCKVQVAKEQKLSGERLLEETAKLFEDVVYHTQVADSVLTRSSLMRSKSQTVKELTSFMAEPTLSVNLLLNAFQDYREGVSKSDKVKRTMKILFCGYVLSAVANAVFTAFADAARDDDEYEGYWDKFFQALLGEKFYDGNLFAELNPLEKIAFVRDVLSLLQGYEGAKNPFVELAESGIKLVQNIVKFFQGKGSLTVYGLIYQSLQVLGGFTGAAPANLLREASTIWNWTFGKWNNMPLHRYKTDPKSQIRDAYKSGALKKSEAREALMAAGISVTDAYWIIKDWDAGESTGRYDDVYKAALAGDDIGAAVAELVEHGEKTEKEVLSQLKSQIGTWYTDPESDTRIDRQEAEKMLRQYFDLDDGEIEEQLLLWDMKVDTGFSLDGLKQKFLDEAVSAEDAVRYLMEYGGKDQEDAQERVDDWAFEMTHGYSYDDIRQTYLDEEITADEAKSVMMEVAGKTKEEADRSIKLWDFEAENGWRYEDRASLYKDGKITREQLVDALVDVGEYDRKDAEYQVEVYEWEKDGLDGATIKRVQKWHEYCEKAGVTKEQFLQIQKFSSDTKNDVDANGKTINFSAMKKVMAEINRLPLSASQKDALARSLGWSDKNIRKYKPW